MDQYEVVNLLRGIRRREKKSRSREGNKRRMLKEKKDLSLNSNVAGERYIFHRKAANHTKQYLQMLVPQRSFTVPVERSR